MPTDNSSYVHENPWVEARFAEAQAAAQKSDFATAARALQQVVDQRLDREDSTKSLSAPYVTQSLAIETVTVLALLSWPVLAAAIPAAGRAARGRPPGSSPAGPADEIAGSRRP